VEMIACPKCDTTISGQAQFCPHCGHQLDAENEESANESTNNPAANRKIGLLLGVGIFLFPLIFSWFTLRKGHSALARVISFVWLGISLLFKASTIFGPWYILTPI